MPALPPETTTLLGLLVWLMLEMVTQLHVLHALMSVRTEQGTIVWVVSAMKFPYLAMPLCLGWGGVRRVVEKR